MQSDNNIIKNLFFHLPCILKLHFKKNLISSYPIHCLKKNTETMFFVYPVKLLFWTFVPQELLRCELEYFLIDRPRMSELPKYVLS